MDKESKSSIRFQIYCTVTEILDATIRRLQIFVLTSLIVSIATFNISKLTFWSDELHCHKQLSGLSITEEIHKSRNKLISNNTHSVNYPKEMEFSKLVNILLYVYA